MKCTARKSTVNRRAEIVEAVLRIVGERGLSSLTTSTLAAEVGVTTGALYRHFASLDEILIETVRQGARKLESTYPDPGLPPVERLLALARNRVQLLRNDPGLVWLLRFEQAQAALPPDAVDLLRDRVRHTREFLLNALRDGAAEGSIRDDVDPELLLVPVVATIHAIVGRRESQPNPESVLRALGQLLQPPCAAPSVGFLSPITNSQSSIHKETAQ